MIRRVPEMPEEVANHASLANPYNVNQAFFAKGYPHMFYNDSARTRLILAPFTDDPLQSRRHRTHMVATRDAVVSGAPADERTLPPLDLGHMPSNTDNWASPAASHREKAVQWRPGTPSEIPRTADSLRMSKLSARISRMSARVNQENISNRQSTTSPLKSRLSPRSTSSSAWGQKEDGFQRKIAYGKMLLPITTA